LLNERVLEKFIVRGGSVYLNEFMLSFLSGIFILRKSVEINIAYEKLCKIAFFFRLRFLPYLQTKVINQNPTNR